MSIGQHVLTRRAILHLLGKARVVAGQHELKQGYQDVRADTGQEVALQDGIGALLLAGAEVADVGSVLLVLGHICSRGSQDAEVGNTLALGNEC